MNDPAPSDVVRSALDALQEVVAKSADDLRFFHDTLAKARLAPLPPFPRASVILAEHVVEHLTAVEHDLEQILVALGLSKRS
jgi:hypothetical protein